MNELHTETSPYLLQHASNPVHWKAWNTSTLELAQKENKLIIISIGYSACHWCHVMEHESFENHEVASLMNAHFINIKIDREERPDIDAVYMKAVQIMTGQGGWPMNIVALPNGKPIWGGTFFKKIDWINSLGKLQELYVNDLQTILEYAEKLAQGIHTLSLPILEKPVIQQGFVEELVQKWTKSFDWEYGGMARAPKFMMPTNYDFLLRYGYQTQNQNILDFVFHTLTKMAHGGLFDTVGGGFSRYAVDMKWHIPHFEKMLYDNGQLVSLYANAYKFNNHPLYKEVIEKTLSFVEREWLTSEGCFYASLDADSLNIENKLEEGSFYVWNKEELMNIIQEDYALFSSLFNINDFGLWENQNYVLIQNKTLDEIALQANIALELLIEKKKNWEERLFVEREKRKKPRLDDKCITSWNAIMLHGYVAAYKALGNPKFLTIALNNGHFIREKVWHEEGHLFRTYKNGIATINAYLEDYAHVIQSFIALYEVTLDEEWLRHAKQLTDYCFDYFYDPTTFYFSFTSSKDAPLIVPNFEIEDNVIPAANSVMAQNLFQLSIYFSNAYYQKISEEMTTMTLPTIDYPSAYSNWLNVFMNFTTPHFEVSISGINAKEYSAKLNALYLPHITMASCESKSNLPILLNRWMENKDVFYICQDNTCQAPLFDFDELKSKIILR
jgi:uncharacterized protein YyaL (SSP411 family)